MTCQWLYIQNIADSFSNIVSPDNNAGWMELQIVSILFAVKTMLTYIFRQILDKAKRY